MASMAVETTFQIAAPPIASASGLLGLLDEDDDVLKSHALTQLSLIVDDFWAEIAEQISKIEELAEDDAFKAKDVAAAVASKCFFHLEEYDSSLRLALSAGEHFDINDKNEYVQCMTKQCIDQYIEQRIANCQAKPEDVLEIDPRLETIIEKMFERCYNDGCFDQALGIALETRRLDHVRNAILNSGDVRKMLALALSNCQSAVTTQSFRLEVLNALKTIHQEHANSAQSASDFTGLALCLQYLDDSEGIARLLEKLVQGTVDDALIAYQVAFDIVENGNMGFVGQVSGALPTKTPVKTEEVAPATPIKTEEGESKTNEASSEVITATLAPAKVTVPAEVSAPDGAHMDYWERLCKLQKILKGGFFVELNCDFSFRNNEADTVILSNIIASVDARNQRNSLLHNAIVTAHSLMLTGTTVDKFLRVNLEWLKRASNWSKFTATAGIGAIHKGHVEDSMTLLETYLPKPGVSGSPYSEGGSLYALGLIHANTTDNDKTVAYLQTALANAGADEVVQHGACLGLGLAAYGNGTKEMVESLMEVLFRDSAVAGEAAAYGLGLLMSGRDMRSDMVSETINAMLQYAHGTTHEKIIRGLSMGIAVAVVGQEERADTLIEQMSRDKDPLVRYGAMYTTGMAYCGTDNNSAIRKLLHVAVSDVNDNVRRAAVTNLGFIMFRNPSQVPKLVSLLSESFNPHVRYGAALAIGIACAGTGSGEALSLLEPMLEDSIDFVRQGALIGTAMVLMQESAVNNPKVKPFRERLASIVGDKFQYLMTKMGAVIAAGVIDAGGRNMVISMQSRVGFRKNIAVVGMAMFCQHWYWYPMPHFLSLSLSPTYIVGLNSELKMPKSFTVKCNAKASRFAYPEKLKEKSDEKKEKVATVSLSTTAKAKSKQAKKAKEGAGEGTAMEVEKDDVATEKPAVEEKEAEKAKKGPEPSTHTLSNPSRVTLPQRALIEFDLNQRYVPIRQEVASGIVMLKDTLPDTNDDELAEVCAPMIGEDQDEASAPKPFVWDSKAAFVIPKTD